MSISVRHILSVSLNFKFLRNQIGIFFKIIRMERIKLYTFSAIVFFTGLKPVYSQQRISDKALNENERLNKEAVLELSSENKGLLHVRVALVNTNSTLPFEKHTAGMMVYNTSKTNDVLPGIYYNDGAKWVLTGSAILYDPNTFDLSFTDAENRSQRINLKANETITTLINNHDGSLTYTAEDGVKTTFKEMPKTGKIVSADLEVSTGDGAVLRDVELNLKDNAVSIQKLAKASADKVLVTDSEGFPKWDSGAMPKFFYMPSIMIALSEDQFVKEVEGESFGTLNLHKRYVKQFNTPLASSNNAPPLPIAAETDLYYYITWYDTAVFDSVTLSETGILKYSVKPNAEVTAGSFMNIVFALK